ncbi:DUF6879 family protein [Micromonospora sp. NPDC005171]|uniref:DUF6879 family protein n=1 Tax=Micromonospora sp. NPDC005171 TaxID=3156866 RepID=UPI0033A7170D
MRELLGGDPGEVLALDDYWADFDQRFWKTGPPGFWKLERQQTFQEPQDEGWQAFAAGRWEEPCGFSTRGVPSSRTTTGASPTVDSLPAGCGWCRSH